MFDILFTEKEGLLLKDILDIWSYATDHQRITGGRLLKGNVRLTWNKDIIHVEVSEQTSMTAEE